MNTITTQDGIKVCFDRILELMNHSILCELQHEFLTCRSDQEFYEIYCAAHLQRFYIPFDIFDLTGLGEWKEFLIPIIKEKQNVSTSSTI